MVYRTGPTIATAYRRPLYTADTCKCLNLGCGANIMPTINDEMWVNLDMFPNEGVNVVHDLEKLPLPFENESFHYIMAKHVLEHIKNFPDLMKELHRILKPKGVLHVRVPYGTCRAAYADPTHKWLFAPETFYHFTKDEIGFQTLKFPNPFILKWLEVVKHPRRGLDDREPGGYFTEIVVDLEKDGEPYDWESLAVKPFDWEKAA